MNPSLEDSFEYCARLTRRRARNFYYAFELLGKEEHDAICAIYAFMRYCDDVSDEPSPDPSATLRRLEQWRADLEASLAGKPAGHPLWPAFRRVVERYRLPQQYFRDMIDGVASDLTPRQFATFEELYRYCYQVASVAGLCVIRILGADSSESDVLAERCGVAFQLTNILRDVREDAGRGRIYFPLDDMNRFGVGPEEILQCRDGEALRHLLRFEADRAREYFKEAEPLPGMVKSKNRAALWGLIEIYRQLLNKIERSGYDVLSRRIRLSVAEKIGVATQALKRRAAGR